MSEQEKIIRVDLLAYGAIGDQHNSTVGATEGLRLTAASETNPDRLTAARALAPDIATTAIAPAMHAAENNLIQAVASRGPERSKALNPITVHESYEALIYDPLVEIVKQISGDSIVTVILPVAYAQSAVRSGFVHVPLMDSQVLEFSGLPTMPLDDMVKAVKTLLTVIS